MQSTHFPWVLGSVWRTSASHHECLAQLCSTPCSVPELCINTGNGLGSWNVQQLLEELGFGVLALTELSHPSQPSLPAIPPCSGSRGLCLGLCRALFWGLNFISPTPGVLVSRTRLTRSPHAPLPELFFLCRVGSGPRCARSDALSISRCCPGPFPSKQGNESPAALPDSPPASFPSSRLL